MNGGWDAIASEVVSGRGATALSQPGATHHLLCPSATGLPWGKRYLTGTAADIVRKKCVARSHTYRRIW